MSSTAAAAAADLPPLPPLSLLLLLLLSCCIVLILVVGTHSFVRSFVRSFGLVAGSQTASTSSITIASHSCSSARPKAALAQTSSVPRRCIHLQRK
eukprot:COSAG06_NODE_16094_length_1022_cov_4.413868_2_plen_95_part_01